MRCFNLQNHRTNNKQGIRHFLSKDSTCKNSNNHITGCYISCAEREFPEVYQKDPLVTSFTYSVPFTLSLLKSVTLESDSTPATPPPCTS